MIKLKPVYKKMLWGGNKIGKLLHKDAEGPEPIAESWELSTHRNGMCSVAEGEDAGKTLNEYLDRVGWEQFGEHAARCHALPIMVKYIDARENLSIQVHPDTQYALTHSGDCGKNEMWFILDADPGACVFLGFQRDVTEEEVRAAVKDGTIEQLLNKIPVRKGDVYYIPAGTIHAIGAGCLLCEIQQTSDATYRLFDYHRKDENGKERECRVEDALAVLNFRKTPVRTRKFAQVKGKAENMLGDIGKLTFIEYNADGESVYNLPLAKFVVALFLEGSGTITAGVSAEAKQGDTFLLTEQTIEISGKCRAILIGY